MGKPEVFMYFPLLNWRFQGWNPQNPHLSSTAWVDLFRTEAMSGFSPSPRNGRGSTPGQVDRIARLTVWWVDGSWPLWRAWPPLEVTKMAGKLKMENVGKKRWPELGRLRTVHSVWGSMVGCFGGCNLDRLWLYSWRYVWSYLHRHGSILTVMHPLYQEVSCIHQRTHPNVSHVSCVGWNSFAFTSFPAAFVWRLAY